MVYFFKENDKVYGYDIVLFNRPGALKFVSSLPEKYSLNIEYIETCFKSKEKYGLFIVIDFTDKEASPDDILMEFKNNREYVYEVSISPAVYNIIFPSNFYVKDLGGVRAILLGMESMKGIIQGIREQIGHGASSVLLYHLGCSVGREIYNTYVKPMGIKQFSDGMFLKTMFRGAGWADIIGCEKSEEKIIIKFKKLWECEIQKGFVDKPSSHFTRGVLAGFFRSFMGKGLVVKETKCIAVGDPYCQFEINIINKVKK